MVEKVKEEIKVYDVVKVPSEFQLAIGTPEGEVIDVNQALALILNKLEEVRKKL